MTKSNPLSAFPSCRHDVAQPDWLCGPCGQTRDSDSLEVSNFVQAQNALDTIDPNGADWEVVRFGHWAVGWVEEIFTRPGSAARAEVERLYTRLDEYPILDEDHQSQLAHEMGEE